METTTGHLWTTEVEFTKYFEKEKKELKDMKVFWIVVSLLKFGANHSNWKIQAQHLGDSGEPFISWEQWEQPVNLGGRLETAKVWSDASCKNAGEGFKFHP